MYGPGYGFGAAGSTRRKQRTGGGPPPPPAFTGMLTLAAIASHETKRIYQRATVTGGGQGKGAGTIALAISGASAGTIGARIVDVDDPATVLQTLADLTITGGQTVLNVAGVDARAGWFYIELCGSNGVWQRMTQKVGMGALYGFAGQSLTARFFGRQDSQTATYASLGITPSANIAVLASYNESNAYMPAVATMPWQTPGDVGDGNGPNAAGVGQFLNQMVALTGVNCGAIGHSQGGVPIGSFASGQANWTRLSDTIARAGGAFEGFVWGQGHSDSVYGCPPNGYAFGLGLLFAQIASVNSFVGYGKYVWTIPAIASSAWGTPYTYNRVRKGAIDWCAANSATYVHMYDLDQVDNVHESQAGSAQMGNHVYRAMRAQYDASSGLGPAPVSAVRSGTTITLTLSDAGQSALNLVGTAGNRIFVFPRGRVDRYATTNNRFPVASVSATNATTLSIILADDPGNAHELDLYLNWPNGPGNATIDNLYDDRTDGDGIAIGRILQANAAPIQIAAVGAGATNAPPGGFDAAISPFSLVETSTTYAAGAGGFGDEMTGGTALAVNNKTPSFNTITIEGFFTCPTITGSTQVLFGGFGPGAAYYVGITSAGKIKAQSGTPTGATTLVAGKRYHVAYVQGPGGRAIYLTNVTDAGSGIRDYSGTPTTTLFPNGARYGLRNLSGNFAMGGGALDEWAVFETERYSGASYTAPTEPFTGAEDGLVALYHCDGDGKDAVAA